jgi:hypothetical protein
MLLRPVTLRRKDYNVDEISELLETSVTLTHCPEESDVAWVTAGVLRHDHIALDSYHWELSCNSKHLFIGILNIGLRLLLAELLVELFDGKALPLDSHKDLTLIEDPFLIDDSHQDAGVLYLYASFLLQVD